LSTIDVVDTVEVGEVRPAVRSSVWFVDRRRTEGETSGREMCACSWTKVRAVEMLSTLLPIRHWRSQR
jgi:hypothetical protein